jgi:putative FmdB family regulatory protein
VASDISLPHLAMPIYAYRCTSCGHAKDVLQKISDPLLVTCPACGQDTFVKQLTAAGFQLKGSGWYVTDFRDGNKGGGKDDKKDGAKEDGSAAPADAGAKPTDQAADKSDGKTAERATDSNPAKPADASAPSPAAAPAPAAPAKAPPPSSAG